MNFINSLLKSSLITGLIFIHGFSFSQVSLHYMENKTPTYEQVISMYQSLSDKYPEARLIETGETDSGEPLHLFIISSKNLFNPAEIRKHHQAVMMINNGIHPGECNGIDASLEFANDLLSKKQNIRALDNTVVLIVPVLNIGGALNRSATHRANQNGPEMHGFRGNAKNLDLNRDFVKLDSKNAFSLVKTIHQWDPDVFFDTHSTNGADYPYTVTIIPGHRQQLEKPQSEFMYNKMLPALFDGMNASPYKMSPYVNVFRTTPDQGFEGFFQYPRYLSGYTSTFHMLSFTVETHMLKPYPDRVLSTRKLLHETLKFTSQNAQEIMQVKDISRDRTAAAGEFVVKWENDTSKYDLIEFEGYTAKTKISELTGHEMIYYDHNDPWKNEIPFFNYFKPVKTITAPRYYIIPAAWHEAVERLNASGIKSQEIPQDTMLTVEMYYLDEIETTGAPYNGHYMHYKTSIRKETGNIYFRRGDKVIPVNQPGNAYIVQVLEPEAYDSFFSWNFFDPVLSRKEYFSGYLFESTAINFLEENPAIKSEYERKRADDALFKADHYAQLRWIYERSPWSEPTYRRYPVFRFNGEF